MKHQPLLCKHLFHGSQFLITANFVLCSCAVVNECFISRPNCKATALLPVRMLISRQGCPFSCPGWYHVLLMFPALLCLVIRARREETLVTTLWISVYGIGWVCLHWKWEGGHRFWPPCTKPPAVLNHSLSGIEVSNAAESTRFFESWCPALGRADPPSMESCQMLKRIRNFRNSNLERGRGQIRESWGRMKLEVKDFLQSS